MSEKKLAEARITGKAIPCMCGCSKWHAAMVVKLEGTVLDELEFGPFDSREEAIAWMPTFGAEVDKMLAEITGVPAVASIDMNAPKNPDAS